MTGLVTRRSRRVALVLVAAASTTRLRFSAKFSVGADSAGEFSRRSLAAAIAQKIGGADLTCATTCRSNWRRQPLALRKRLRSPSLTHATNAKAAAPNQAHERLPVPLVVVAVR